jgi:hypothetical protein
VARCEVVGRDVTDLQRVGERDSTKVAQPRSRTSRGGQRVPSGRPKITP